MAKEKDKANRKEEKKKEKTLLALSRKANEANKLINEESNRLITWALSIIGGSILMIISTSYVRPTGYFLYSYFLFAVGWICTGTSIYFGEMLTRIYIAGATTDESNRDQINKIGKEVDRKFSLQIRWFQAGIVVFSMWLIAFLTWFIYFKE